MILTRFDRLMINEMPLNIANALEFLSDNYHSITKNKNIIYPHPSLQYRIIRSFLADEELSWQSHRNHIYCYTIISGQEIIEINDISELEITRHYRKETDQILYRGASQSRIRMQKDNIIILYPEDAYRFHYVPNHPCTKFLLQIPVSYL